MLNINLACSVYLVLNTMCACPFMAEIVVFELFVLNMYRKLLLWGKMGSRRMSGSSYADTNIDHEKRFFVLTMSISARYYGTDWTTSTMWRLDVEPRPQLWTADCAQAPFWHQLINCVSY